MNLPGYDFFIEVQVRPLLAAALFTAPDDPQHPSVRGINLSVQDNTLTLSATNRYSIFFYQESIITEINDGVRDFEITVPTSLLENIKPARRGFSDPCIISVKGEAPGREIALQHGESVLYAGEIAYPFPGWRQNIPEAVTNELAFYPHRQLRLCARAADIVGRKGKSEPLVFPNGPDRPGVVKFLSAYPCGALLMPTRYKPEQVPDMDLLRAVKAA